MPRFSNTCLYTLVSTSGIRYLSRVKLAGLVQGLRHDDAAGGDHEDQGRHRQVARLVEAITNLWKTKHTPKL